MSTLTYNSKVLVNNSRVRIGFSPRVSDFIDATGLNNEANLNTEGLYDARTARLAARYLIDSWYVNGLWTTTKALYPYIGGTEFINKFNAKDPRNLDIAGRLLFNGSFTHGGFGSKGNGDFDSYAETFLNQSGASNYSFGVSISLDDKALPNLYPADIGTGEEIDDTVFIRSYVTGNDSEYAASNLRTVVPNVTDPRGFHLTTRISSTESYSFKNGTLIVNQGAGGWVLSRRGSFWLFAVNAMIRANSPRTQSIAYIGDGISQSEAKKMSVIVSNYNRMLNRI